MIPDFKTYLSESLWADVQSQASGDTVKKEDDVDLMDIYQFEGFVRKRYETDKFSSIYNFDQGNHKNLTIPICREYNLRRSVLKYYWENERIRINFPKDFSDFNEAVKKRFDPRPCDAGRQEYVIEGDRVKNSLVIDLIDFMIDNIELDSSLVPILTRK